MAKSAKETAEKLKKLKEKEKKLKEREKAKKAKEKKAKAKARGAKAKAPAKRKAPAEKSPKRPAKAIKKTEADYEPVNMWWEKGSEALEGMQRGGEKWKYLEHHGIIFTPPYEVINKPLIYDGKPIHLEPHLEEIAGHFAKKLSSDHVEKEAFQRNFWKCFQEALPEGHPIKGGLLGKCDFTAIKKHYDDKREEQKARSSDEKKAQAAEKKKAEEYYRYAIMDEVRETVGGIAAEPPQLFLGRGEHPRMGLLKERLLPEGVTLNCAETAPVPRCPEPGHCFADVVHDNRVTWLSFYRDPVLDGFKYQMLHASSSLKGMPDFLKYERARRLKGIIDKIRNDYQSKWFSEDPIEKMIGVSTYLIDKLALRAGNEKDTEDEADTVGCCSLRVEHVQFEEPDQVTFDFLGKDSIRFHQTVTVHVDAFKAMRSLTKNKTPDQMIFDKIDPGTLNEYFHEFMPDLSIKVFRTYNASITLHQELWKYDPTKLDCTNHAAIYQFYEAANRQVAILCNHQKGVAKNFGDQMQKMNDQLALLEGQLEDLVKQEKLFKRNADNIPKAGKVLEKLPQSQEACVKARAVKERQVSEHKRKITMKEENKTTSLGTSKMNYMDPRITVAFCKRAELAIEKCFAGTHRTKFPWAMHVESTFEW